LGTVGTIWANWKGSFRIAVLDIYIWANFNSRNEICDNGKNLIHSWVDLETL